MVAEAAILALGLMPEGGRSGGKKTGNSLATAMRALRTRIKVFMADVRPPDTRIAEAALFSAARK
jgi:hypothetical protein